MNERMRKLAEEAGIIHIHMSVGEIFDALQKFEKCAELIVQECVDICYKQIVGAVGSYPSAHNNAVDACVKNIKEHFGIK